MATKPMRGPGGRAMHATERPKNTCLAVVICIVLTVLAQLNGTLFLQKLYDSYLSPMLESGSTDFTPLLHKLIQVGAVYAIGVLCSWGYTRLMVNVSQGTMRNFREKLFGHMESLPISYFDTHSHGDIMSVYTNDIDTLRQFIGQSLPQLFSSIISIVRQHDRAQCAADAADTCHGGSDAVRHEEDRREVRQVFRPAAAGPRQGQRLHRGNDAGPEGREGLQPRAGRHRALQRAQRAAARQLLPRQQLCKRPHAGQRPARQRQLCTVRRGGRGAGAAWLCRSDARHARGVHDAQPQLQPAHHAGQPAAELRRHGHGRCGARVPAAR